MLEVTVKTLDSQSRSFSVANDITVHQFKEQISSSVDIPVDRQRLIYQGRVLQDDAQLNASGDIHGKVVHLVERLPAPAQPTPAEQARAGQRTQQPTSQGNAQPRGPTPAGGNLLGPFPIPPGAGGAFSGQFMQQMIQQALSGMGGMGNQYGPTVVRSTVRHPNAPGGNARAEIQIHITGRDGSAQSGRTNNQPRQPTPTSQQQQQQQQQRGATATPQQVPPTQTRGQQTQPQNVQSEPRRQLNYVEYLVTRFEENVNILESGNYEQALQSGQVPSIYRSSTSTAESSGSATTTGQSTSTTTSTTTTTTTSSEPMEVQTSSDADSSQQQPASAATGSSVDGPAPSEPAAAAAAAAAAAPRSDNSTRHPTLPEVGRVMRRVTALETRFLPFLTEYTDFLENDPAFTSTESPEYKRMMGFLTIILKTQRALALIHRSLSLINIPLVETPPRRMLVQAECPRHRGPPAQARRIHNLASAGHSYLNPGVRIQHRHPGPHVVHGPYQVGVPVIFGPVGPGATGNMRPRMMQMRPEMFGFGPTPPRPVRPHQSGLYGHPPAQTPSANAAASPQTPATQRPAVVRTLPAPPVATTRAATESSGNGAAAVVMTQTSTTNTSGPTPNAVGSGPTTHVEFMPPEYSVQVTTHIQPQININITPGGLAAGTNGSEDVDVATDFVTSGTEEVVEPMDEGQPEPQAVFGFSGSVETDEDGNVMPVQLNLPNIPGVSQDGMRQILESVQNSVQQVVNSAQQQEQTSQQGGRISVRGLSGGQDQVPLEIANIIGQTVQNIVLNHLHTDPEQQGQTASSTQAATSSTQSSSTTQAAPSVSASQSSSQSTVVPPNAVVVTTAPATTKAPSSSFSSASTSTASSRPSTSSASVSATSGDSEQRSRNMLAELLSQISGGSFGNTEVAAAASSRASSSSGRRVLGSTGRSGRELPLITRTPNCVNDIVRGQGYPQEMMELTGQENIISLVLYLSGELLTIPECMSFMAGAPEPANRLREPLRQALIQCWFNGSVPTREEIETEVDRHSEEARPSIMSYFENEEPKSPDISIVESNLSLYRHVLRRILHLLFLHESEHFARDILRHMLDCFALVLHLNIHILRGTEEVVQQLVMRHLGSALDPFTLGATSDQTDPMVEQMRFALSSQLIPFARSRPVTQEQIDQFVMNVPAVEPPPSPETEAADPSSEAPHASAAATSVPVPTGAVKVELEEDKETESAMDEDVPTEEAAGNSAQKDEKTEPAGAAAAPRETDPDWRSMVQEQWVSVIESDIEKQKTLPEQPPYSEAYLAGMPASKRRKM